MLIVDIYVNSTFIARETAIRIKGGTHPNNVNTYQLGSNGKIIKHRYGDGAAKLGQEMLKNLQKKGV